MKDQFTITGNKISSNVFHMFREEQIVELKNAFSLFGINEEGKLSKKNFSAFVKSIGLSFTRVQISEMIEQLAPNYDFISFLIHFGKMLSEIDDETEIIRNFKLFDFEGKGTITQQDLIEIIGDEYSLKEFQILISDCYVNDDEINYTKLANKIKHGENIKSVD